MASFVFPTCGLAALRPRKKADSSRKGIAGAGITIVCHESLETLESSKNIRRSSFLHRSKPEDNYLVRRNRKNPVFLVLASSESNRSNDDANSGTVSRKSFLRGAAAGAISTLSTWAFASDDAEANSSADTQRGEKGVIFDTRKHSFLPPQPSKIKTFSSETSAGGVICIGETHTHILHHRLQLETITALVGMNAKPMAIGMEMFMRGHQPLLDDFIDGEIGLRKLLDQTQWRKTWGYDSRLYAPILRYARLHRIPVVGLNAPQELVHAVGQGGLQSLSADMAKLLPEMDLDNRTHMAQFIMSMLGTGAAHGGINLPMLRNYYQAKTLWDEYMAESASNYMQSAQQYNADWGDGGLFVILAGNSHIEGRVSIPDRVTRRTGVRPFVIVPRSVQFDGVLPVIDEPLPLLDLADWIWYTRREVDLV